MILQHVLFVPSLMALELSTRTRSSVPIEPATILLMGKTLNCYWRSVTVRLLLRSKQISQSLSLELINIL